MTTAQKIIPKSMPQPNSHCWFFWEADSQKWSEDKSWYVHFSCCYAKAHSASKTLSKAEMCANLLSLSWGSKELISKSTSMDPRTRSVMWGLTTGSVRGGKKKNFWGKISAQKRCCRGWGCGHLSPRMTPDLGSMWHQLLHALSLFCYMVVG